MAFLFIALIYFRPELVDAFYLRFTTPKTNSLILGTSRSAQGILPSVFNERLLDEENQIINHSFAVGPSNFGPNYLREIKQKTKPTSSNGLFIVSVDPWSLATSISNIDDDTSKFYEVQNNLFVGNLKSSSKNPNFDYLNNYWSDRFSVFENLFKDWINYKKLILLHKDGWLEVDYPLDLKFIKKRVISSTEEYAKKKSILSKTRFEYLNKIIKLLNKKGHVVLVRMPVSSPMAKLEHNKFPDFSKMISELAEKNQIDFFDFIKSSGQYLTIDTHHLYKDEARRFSNILCDSIKKQKYSNWK
jgi:hypothetical protein